MKLKLYIFHDYKTVKVIPQPNECREIWAEYTYIYVFLFHKKDNPYAVSQITKNKEQEVYMSKREPPFEKVS